MSFKLPKLTKVLSPFSLLSYSVQGYLVSWICFCLIIVQAVAAFNIFAIFVQPNGEVYVDLQVSHGFLYFSFIHFQDFQEKLNIILSFI